MEILAIIQARTGSTRFPGKVLLPLEDKTVLEHVVLRVKKSKKINKVLVATTTKRKDKKIADLCKKKGFNLFRGSSDDVLDRYFQASKLYKAKYIVRVTADCPMIDPQIIDKVIQEYFETRSDYIGIEENSVPDGEDVEVFAFEALKFAWENARLASEREHVTPFIKKHPEKFKITLWKSDQILGDKRWTLDEPEDYKFLKIIFKKLYPKNPFFGVEEIIDFLKKNPEIEKINSHIGRNEGLQKSLREDRIVK